MEQTPEQVLKHNAGARVSRRARTTKTVVTLYDGIAADMDTEGGYRWQTVCEKHSTIIAHANYAVALSHLSHPEEWCEVCMGEDTMPMSRHKPEPLTQYVYAVEALTPGGWVLTYSIGKVAFTDDVAIALARVELELKHGRQARLVTFVRGDDAP